MVLGVIGYMNKIRIFLKIFKVYKIKNIKIIAMT